MAAETGDPDSVWSRYQALIALRAAHPALRSASLVPVASSAPAVYAYLRDDPASGETIAVVSNLSDEAVPAATLRLATGPLCGTPTATGLLDGASTPAAPPVNGAGGFDAWQVGPLPPHGDLIVRLGS